jgi:hypothetical protein
MDSLERVAGGRGAGPVATPRVLFTLCTKPAQQRVIRCERVVPYQECGPLLCRVPSPYGANRVAAPQDKTAGSKEMAEAARGGAHMDPEPVHLVVSGYVDEVPGGLGHIVVSEIEAPNLFANLVCSG